MTQLGIFDPPADGWWEYGTGSSTVWVVADSEAEAREKAEDALRDIGVLPGPMHGSYLRFREATA